MKQAAPAIAGTVQRERVRVGESIPGQSGYTNAVLRDLHEQLNRRVIVCVDLLGAGGRHARLIIEGIGQQ
jgi:RNA-binding protein YhbY